MNEIDADLRDLKKTVHYYLTKQLRGFIKKNLTVEIQMVDDDELDKNCMVQANVKFIGPDWYTDKLKLLRSKDTVRVSIDDLPVEPNSTTVVTPTTARADTSLEIPITVCPDEPQNIIESTTVTFQTDVIPVVLFRDILRSVKLPAAMLAADTDDRIAYIKNAIRIKIGTLPAGVSLKVVEPNDPSRCDIPTEYCIVFEYKAIR